jgi:hypothetical protein
MDLLTNIFDWLSVESNQKTLALIFSIFGGSFFVKKIITKLAPSPLEIIFDTSNPAKRFWSMESPKDESGLPKPGVFWEYRVEVKNNSQRTIRNVSVTIEHLGQCPLRPRDQIFDKINKISCDLKPGCSELVPVVRWPIPKIQAGMLAGLSALEYGPIKIIASGDDSKPSVRTFNFDYQTEQMLFD